MACGSGSSMANGTVKNPEQANRFCDRGLAVTDLRDKGPRPRPQRKADAAIVQRSGNRGRHPLQVQHTDFRWAVCSICSRRSSSDPGINLSPFAMANRMLSSWQTQRPKSAFASTEIVGCVVTCPASMVIFRLRSIRPIPSCQTLKTCGPGGRFSMTKRPCLSVMAA